MACIAKSPTLLWEKSVYIRTHLFLHNTRITKWPVLRVRGASNWQSNWVCLNWPDESTNKKGQDTTFRSFNGVWLINDAQTNEAKVWPRLQCAFECRVLGVSCILHRLTQLAAFFLDQWAEWSTTNSCYCLFSNLKCMHTHTQCARAPP